MWAVPSRMNINFGIIRFQCEAGDAPADAGNHLLERFFY